MNQIIQDFVDRKTKWKMMNQDHHRTQYEKSGLIMESTARTRLEGLGWFEDISRTMGVIFHTSRDDLIEGTFHMLWEDIKTIHQGVQHHPNSDVYQKVLLREIEKQVSSKLGDPVIYWVK